MTVIFNTLRMNERILVFALAGSRVIVAAVILYTDTHSARLEVHLKICFCPKTEKLNLR